MTSHPHCLSARGVVDLCPTSQRDRLNRQCRAAPLCPAASPLPIFTRNQKSFVLPVRWAALPLPQWATGAPGEQCGPGPASFPTGRTSACFCWASSYLSVPLPASSLVNVTLPSGSLGHLCSVHWSRAVLSLCLRTGGGTMARPLTTTTTLTIGLTFHPRLN